MKVVYEQLNNSQKMAVDWNDGPLLVLAGPGSGKTAVLTLRIARIINETTEETFRILGLTFTVKAANEMQKRLQELLGEKSKRVKLCTFHSFCTDVLRQHGSHLGLKPDFSVVTDDKDRAILLKNLHDHGQLDIPNPEDALKKIDSMFTHGILPEDLPNYFDDGKEEQCKELQDVFIAYISELLTGNQLDFGSMLYFTRRLLQTKLRIARQVRTVFKHICVDEFQDTNISQYQILRLLAPDNKSNFFVVADDDQIIFQWNGADPKRLEELKTDYNPELIQLPENYRCPQEIVEIANRLIQHNNERITSKNIGVSHNLNTGVIELASYDVMDNELEGLATNISEIGKENFGNCLVIARTNKLLTAALKVLKNKGINAEIVTKSHDFSTPLMQLVFYSLKLVNSPDSRSILNKLCATATAINGVILSAEEISAQASVDGKGVLRTFYNFISSSEKLKRISILGIKYLCDTVQYNSFVDGVLNQFNMMTKDESDNDIYPDYQSDIENWHRISADIITNQGKNVSLHVFLQEMGMTPKIKSLPKNCIRLQTVHTAKGMEFDHVFIIGLAEDQFPTYFAIKGGKSSVEEERRNCFVAITRASKSLYVSYARKYYGWSKEPSRFLIEMGLIE
ncbi:MAG: ATP-dependent helicase [SAR324 cluster bacterium]|nr:ATP-dependent helicase [SAR324 cluster bacterium]